MGRKRARANSELNTETAPEPTPAEPTPQVLVPEAPWEPGSELWGLATPPTESATVVLHFADGRIEAGFYRVHLNEWLVRVAGTAQFYPLPDDADVVGWSALR